MTQTLGMQINALILLSASRWALASSFWNANLTLIAAKNPSGCNHWKCSSENLCVFSWNDWPITSFKLDLPRLPQVPLTTCIFKNLLHWEHVCSSHMFTPAQKCPVWCNISSNCRQNVLFVSINGWILFLHCAYIINYNNLARLILVYFKFGPSFHWSWMLCTYQRKWWYLQTCWLCYYSTKPNGTDCLNHFMRMEQKLLSVEMYAQLQQVQLNQEAWSPSVNCDGCRMIILLFVFVSLIWLLFSNVTIFRCYGNYRNWMSTMLCSPAPPSTRSPL